MRRSCIALLAGLAVITAYIPSAAVAAHGSGRSLARITFYSSDRGSGGPIASTGVRLQEGKHVAVDPSIIPYGSTVNIPGLGSRKAVDCGSAVTARTAARKAAGGNKLKAKAIVIDVFVAKQSTLRRMANTFPMFVDVTWQSNTTKAASKSRRMASTDAPSRKSDLNSTSKALAQDRPERKTLASLASRG